MNPSVAPVTILWDGARHVAAVWTESVATRFLAAEETGGRVTLIAAGDGEASPLVGLLPQGSRVVHAVSLSAAGERFSVPVQLDERLVPGEAEAGAGGLSLVLAHAGATPDALTVAHVAAGSRPDVGETLVASGLNQVGGDAAAGLRLLAGPFLHPADAEATQTRASATRDAAGGLLLSFTGSGSASGILVAHMPAAMREARRALAQIEPELRVAIESELDALDGASADTQKRDASGLDPVAALRRGFTLHHPLPTGASAASLTLADWREADEIVLFAEPRRQLSWTGEGETVTGAPLALRWQDGRLAAFSHRERYQAAVGTGLTLAGQGAGSLVVAGEAAGGAPLNDDLAQAAGRLAARLWQQGAATRPQRLAAVLDGIAAARALAASGPFARLDARARAPGRRSSLLDALAESCGLDPSRTDELGERPLDEQIALMLWAMAEPRLAVRACAARLLPSAPGGGRSAAQFERLLAWYEDPALPSLLGREAMALAGQDRQAMRLLHDVAASAHQSWLTEALVAEVEQTVAAARKSRGQRQLGSLDSLLLELRRKAARRPAAMPPLETVARMRSELASAAAEAGVAPALSEDLSRRLGELTPGEIVLVHGHFAGLRRRVAEGAIAARLIAGWEATAGLGGLAARSDRAGDSLRGATRLAAGSQGFVTTVDAIETLRPGLTALDAGIAAALGPGDGGEEAATLRRTLAGYGRLLLANAALREADAVFATVPFAEKALGDAHDPGFGAAYRRLRAGAGDTLARYLEAAAAVSGLERDWGTSLSGALPPQAEAEAGRENG